MNTFKRHGSFQASSSTSTFCSSDYFATMLYECGHQTTKKNALVNVLQPVIVLVLKRGRFGQ
jgi:hypothetical protein